MFSLFSIFLILPSTCSTLFPYTTLFRSNLINTPAYAGWDTARNRLQNVLTVFSAIWRLGSISIGSVKIGCLRSEEHTSELQSRRDIVCRLLLEKIKPYVTNALPSPIVLK